VKKSRYSDELESYFAGEHLGAMGLKSSMGAMLDRAESAALSEHAVAPPQWDGHSCPPEQEVACRGSQSGASVNSTEASEAALAAVQTERRIRMVLARLTREEAGILRAYYQPAPPGMPVREEAVVAFRIGMEHTRKLLMLSTLVISRVEHQHTPALRAQKADAKDALASEMRLAERAFDRAIEAYGHAADSVRKEVMNAKALKWMKSSRGVL
jgi:hypothetical protein